MRIYSVFLGLKESNFYQNERVLHGFHIPTKWPTYFLYIVSLQTFTLISYITNLLEIQKYKRNCKVETSRRPLNSTMTQLHDKHVHSILKSPIIACKIITTIQSKDRKIF